MLKSDFIIRKSAVQEGFYIDFEGEYEPEKIEAITGIDVAVIKETCLRFRGVFNQELNVYYFKTKDYAEQVVAELSKKTKPAKNVVMVELTTEEIEYIRKALINEDSNVIFTKSKIRTSIFDKLNR